MNAHAQEGTYSDEEEHTEKVKTKEISVDACIKEESVNIDPLISQSLTYLDTTESSMNEKLKSLRINKSAKRIHTELSFSNTNSSDTLNEDALDNSLFSDSETSLFESKSKSIIFLNENDDEEDDNEDAKKEEEDEATIREYEEYIKKHNKRRKRKKKSKKRKQYSSPLVITESNSSHLWDLYSFEDAIDIRLQHQALYEEPEPEHEPEPEPIIQSEPKKKKALKKRRSKEKLLSPKTKTVFKKTTLRRSSTHKKNDPEYRKLQREKKEAKNLSRMGFKIKTKNRYRIDDGRIGVCKFKGRTAFGKPHEDWIGIMIEHGDGAHNGTVDGVSYFRCAPGKGIMVRPERIIEDMGLPNGYELTPKMIRGSKSIRRILEDIAFKKEQDLIYGD